MQFMRLIFTKIIFICTIVKILAIPPEAADILTKGLNPAALVDTMNLLSEKFRDSHPQEARDFAKEAYKKAKENQYTRGLSRAQNNIGIIFDLEGDFENALIWYFNALDTAKKHQDTLAAASALNNIGIVHYFMHDYAGALRFYEEALKYEAMAGNPEDPSILNNMGTIASYSDEPLSAERYHRRALESAEAVKDTNNMISALLGLGKTEVTKESFKTALEFYRKAEAILKKHPITQHQIVLYFALANTYNRTGNHQQAWNYAEKTLELAKRSGIRERQQYAYELLARLHAEAGSYRKAYDYHTRFAGLRDSLRSENLNTQLAEMQAKYDNERLEREKNELELQNQEVRLARQKTRNTLYIIASFLIISVLLIVFYHQKSHTRKKINTLLQEKQHQTEKSLHEKELLLGEIHHRVKNNLQLISSMLELQARTLENEPAIKAIADSQKRVQSMALIHQRLYQNENPGSISMQDYLVNLMNSIHASYQMQHVSIKTRIEDISLDIDSAIPLGLLVTEILTNAYKHAFASIQNGELSLVLQLQNENLLLKISDNGPGYNEQQISEHNSFGMRLIKSLIRQMKGDIHITNEQGSHFLITLKKFNVYEPV